MARPQGQSLLASLAELLDLLTRYAKEQAGATVEDYVARPIRRASRWAALTLVGSVFVALAAIFIAMGVFLLLAALLGRLWLAFLVVGGALLISAGITARLRNRGENGQTRE